MKELLTQEDSLVIKQRREMIEFLGFETRNKYDVCTKNGQVIGYAAEQQKGILGVLLRQIFGHWRSFDINLYGMDRALQFVAHHPFRFYFQRLEVQNDTGREIGHLEREFAIFTKKFKMLDATGNEVCQMRSGFFKIWTFPFTRNGKEVARISKKWGGALTEIFLDSDTFLLEFLDPSLTADERAVLVSAAVFVDLLYFENNQGGEISTFLPG